ncbi:MAG: aspartyl protease family protein [Bacteroidota bacterium]|nr:aspartyl protease family protein [Bacteroidota bacterium]
MKCITIVIALLSSILSFAQEKNTLSFSREDKRQLTIPFLLVSNLVVIPVSINNSDTLNFILDTGLKSTIITNLPPEDSTLLTFSGSAIVKGLGEEKDLTVKFSYNNTIEINTIKSTNYRFLYIEENRFNLTGELGMEIHGIIGSDVFKNFIVKINYSTQRITFYNPEKYNTDRKLKHYEIIPLEFYHGKPYINIPAQCKNNKSFLAKLLIDTGSGDAVWLFKNTNSNIQIPAKHRYSYLGKGLSGNIHGNLGRIQGIKLGKYSLNDVTCAFPDTAALKNVIIQDIPGRNGSIGAEVLHRFTIIFDYQNQRMAIRKNRNYNEIFRFNNAGLTAKAPYGLLPFFVVSNIRAGSAAEIAGIQEGDQIISLNGTPANQLKVTDINGSMRDRAGKKIRLKIRRGNTILKFTFNLKGSL